VVRVGGVDVNGANESTRSCRCARQRIQSLKRHSSRGRGRVLRYEHASGGGRDPQTSSITARSRGRSHVAAHARGTSIVCIRGRQIGRAAGANPNEVTAGRVGSTSRKLRTTPFQIRLIAAPILIDAKTSRTFLEQAQQLGGQLVNILASDGKNSSNRSQSTALLDQAHQRLTDAAVPLLALLEFQPRIP